MQEVADAQVVTQALTQAAIEARVKVQEMVGGARAEAGARPKSEVKSMEPKLGGSTLKEPTFDWSTMDRYTELCTFRFGVNNISDIKYK